MYNVYNSPFLFRAQQCLPLYSEPSQHSWDIHNHKSNILVPSIASTFSCCIGKNVFDLTLFFHACHWLLPQNVSTQSFFFFFFFILLLLCVKANLQDYYSKAFLGGKAWSIQKKRLLFLTFIMWNTEENTQTTSIRFREVQSIALSCSLNF